MTAVPKEVEASVRLRELVRQVVDDHPGATIRELAEFVAKLTDDADVTEFYTVLLERLVDEVLSHQRRGAMDRNLKARNRSPKLEQRRRWWADLLAARVHVGATLKTVGECTVDDLQVCVDERQVHIERVKSQILNYQKLIELMVKHGARTVADLPEQEIDELRRGGRLLAVRHGRRWKFRHEDLQRFADSLTEAAS